MASAPKPWERQHGVNQRQPNFNPDNANAFVSVSPHSAPGTGGGGLSRHSHPPLPPRPNTTRPTTVSCPSYSTYGSYGGYNSLGGSYYGGGYNAYGATYGNYNRLGMMGVPVTDQGFMQAAEESSRQAFQNIESIVHAFGSVSMMLESSYYAVYSSFRAVLGVADHFSRMKSHFAQIFSALAVVKTLRWLYRKLLYLIGLRSQDPSLEAAWRNTGGVGKVSVPSITEADIKASKSSWPIVMFLAVVFGGPYVIWRLLSSLAPPVTKARGWVRGQGEHFSALAQYSFQAADRYELSFRAGQSLFLAPRDQQPNVRGWLLASNGNNYGLVPANYIKILGLRSDSSLPGNAQTKQGGPAELGSRSRVVASGIPNMPAPKDIPPASPGLPQTPAMPGTLPHTFGQQPQNSTSGQLPQEPSLTSTQSSESEVSLSCLKERKIDAPDQQCTLSKDDGLEARLDEFRDYVDEAQESRI